MIKNGSNKPLNQQKGSLPDVSSALENWFQAITFIKIVKSIVNGRLQEVETPISFRGVWQPMKTQDLEIKPEGQRDWRWFTIHSDTDIELKPDDKISYLNREFRVMKKNDYGLYGYFQYEVVEGYINA